MIIMHFYNFFSQLADRNEIKCQINQLKFNKVNEYNDILTYLFKIIAHAFAAKFSTITN